MKTHRTAVVLIPPLEVWEPIQAIRRRYDRQFKRWMPHVTLLYPFRPAERFEEIRPVLERCCASIEPFQLRLEVLNSFEHSPAAFTMWLAPEPAEPVVRLQSALLDCAPDCNDVNLHPTGFLPHLSLGQAHSRTELGDRMRWVNSILPVIDFAAAEIAMIRRGPGKIDPFQVDCLIQLGEPVSRGRLAAPGPEQRSTGRTEQ